MSGAFGNLAAPRLRSEEVDAEPFHSDTPHLTRARLTALPSPSMDQLY
jgi:hypothetical protein